MRKVEVCFTPALIHQFDLQGKIVVVIDVFRATSSMVTALAHGVSEIRPVASTDECLAYQKQGFITAAERNGEKVDGFDFGNSPFSYIDNEVVGKSLSMTTTNGTLAISKSENADELIIGSFINISAVVNYLETQDRDVVFFCAGWKGKVNTEDTLFAGCVIKALGKGWDLQDDSTQIALQYSLNLKDEKAVQEHLLTSNHALRLSAQEGIMRDLIHCTSYDLYDIVPVLRDKSLVVDELSCSLVVIPE